MKEEKINHNTKQEKDANQQVESFEYVGVTIIKDSSEIDEINRRMVFANKTCYPLPVLTNKNVHGKTKLLIKLFLRDGR